MLRKIVRVIIHGRVYFMRAATWGSGLTLSLMIWERIESRGHSLEWWQGGLLFLTVITAMIAWGWAEFKFKSVDIEQEIYAQHTPTLRRIEKK